MTDSENPKDEAVPVMIGKALGRGVAREIMTWIRWSSIGAALGAVLGGGGAFYFFGVPGIVWGPGLGGALGSLAGLGLLYAAATAEFF